MSTRIPPKKEGMRGNREERLHAWVYYRHDTQQHKNNTLHRVPKWGNTYLPLLNTGKIKRVERIHL